MSSLIDELTPAPVIRRLKETAKWSLQFVTPGESLAIVLRDGKRETAALEKTDAVRHIVTEFARELGLTVGMVDLY